jgi:AcrR family transcriptional regulator
MDTRAAGMQATRERILDTAAGQFMEHWYDEVTLRGVAAAAGVSLGTVVNHFGTKEGLFAAFADRVRAEATSLLAEIPVDDYERAVKVLVDRYEATGDANIRALALEGRVDALRPLMEDGRRHMAEWAERTFASALAGRRGRARERRVALLALACDVLTWKQLRRDRGLSRTETTLAMRELVAAIIDD